MSDVTERAKAVLAEVAQYDQHWIAAHEMIIGYHILNEDGDEIARFRGVAPAEYASFAAASRQLVPELVAEVERLRGVIRELEAQR